MSLHRREQTVTKAALSAALVVLCCACEAPPLALHSLSRSAAERRWEPMLVGTWAKAYEGRSAEQTSGGVETSSDGYRFTRTGYARYRVSFPEGDLAFTAYVVPIQGADFLDVTPDLDEGIPLFLPVHFFARIRIDGDVLRYAWISESRWEEQLERHGAPVVHSREGDLLLTGPTDSLRTLLQEMLADSTIDWEMDSLARASSAQLP
jgi:hypothetical protein